MEWTQVIKMNFALNHLQSVPSSVALMPCLESLNVSNNYIKRLPVDWSKAISLRYLDVSTNALETLSESWLNHPCIRVLNVRHNLGLPSTARWMINAVAKQGGTSGTLMILHDDHAAPIHPLSSEERPRKRQRSRTV